MTNRFSKSVILSIPICAFIVHGSARARVLDSRATAGISGAINCYSTWVTSFDGCVLPCAFSHKDAGGFPYYVTCDQITLEEECLIPYNSKFDCFACDDAPLACPGDLYYYADSKCKFQTSKASTCAARPYDSTTEYKCDGNCAP